MEGGERRLVQPIELDAAVLGDVVLQQTCRNRSLLRRQPRMLLDESRETRCSTASGVEPHEPAEHREQRARASPDRAPRGTSRWPCRQAASTSFASSSSSASCDTALPGPDALQDRVRLRSARAARTRRAAGTRQGRALRGCGMYASAMIAVVGDVEDLRRHARRRRQLLVLHDRRAARSEAPRGA